MMKMMFGLSVPTGGKSAAWIDTDEKKAVACNPKRKSSREQERDFIRVF